MKKRRLGRNGPEVSAIGFGAMSFAGFYGPTSRDESFATLDAAWEAGIDFFDTAELYGPHVSEEIIGAWMRERGHRPHIATKGGIVLGAPRGTTDNSRPGLRRALEGSLSRLGVDSVALYYVHRREFSRPIEEVTETLESFREEGLIGGFGYSEIAPASLRRAAKVAHVMAVQNEYSLWTRYPDLGLVRACAEEGTALVAFSPLARGVLSDTDLDPASFGERDFRKTGPRFQEPAWRHNMAHVRALRAFAHARGWTTSALALAWLLSRGDHVIPIPGTRTPAHLAEWAGADQIVLSDADLDEIDRIMPPGWAEGDRYSDAQIIGVERYC